MIELMPRDGRIAVVAAEVNPIAARYVLNQVRADSESRARRSRVI